ncbi:MAB_1171c family putative transporter [Amycolatopsis sp. 195334CR]|uniref:MAB_1171c family putative transporter n=1 Tax=Amycolatopsis sp. 195334CR TaxID=2814588 RepID=UPI001A8F876D|nr:MAB_1171c family putative transporter [Amycolatopsis sp. 195334CR]MBN6034173.1 hypothetical protein [Amycolatopsis sp. 195334CR]
MSWLIGELLAACLAVALVWKGAQLARRPQDVPLQAIVAFLAFALLGQLSRELAGEATLSQGGPVWAAVLWHGSVAAACVALLCFFDAATLTPAATRRRTLRNIPALLVALVVMAGAAMAAPLPVSKPHMSIIYFTANLFMCVVFVACTRSALRYARQAEPRLAWGLRLAAAGFALVAAALAAFLVVVTTYWFTGTVPLPFTTVNGSVAILGLVAIVIGLLYPAARMRLAALAVWWRHRRAFHDLDALWTALHNEFPDDTLSRVTRKPWDVLGVAGVHRRYYRRVIECRDGLVRISPYISQLRNQHRKDASVAELLQHALRAHSTGQLAPGHAIPIAIPATTGVDADVAELLTLSKSLGRPKTTAQGGAA